MGLFTSAVDFSWIRLESQEQLADLFRLSETMPVLFFKHSTRCGVSRMALNNFEQEWTADSEICTCVFLDLLSYRALSNIIAEKTGVPHESPQAILIKNGNLAYQASHHRISAEAIEKLL